MLGSNAMVLTVGTDCSGIEAPLEALQQLGVKYDHLFSSEISKTALAFIQKNHKPKQIYGDITTRNVRTVPYVDLYVTGVPCQPYSDLNHHKKQDDGRKEPVHAVLKYIRAKKPKHVIIENIVRFQNSDGYAKTMATLRKLGYHVDSKVLSPHEYGIPQHRPRSFIVASLAKPIQWPAPIRLRKTVLDLIDHSVRDKPAFMPCVARWLKTWQIPSDMKGVIETNRTGLWYPCYPRNGKPPQRVPKDKLHTVVKADIAPTLVCHNPSQLVNHLNRTLLPKEMLLLQGFRPTVQFPQMGYLAINSLCGNSMNVAVLKRIIELLLR